MQFSYFINCTSPNAKHATPQPDKHLVQYFICGCVCDYYNLLTSLSSAITNAFRYSGYSSIIIIVKSIRAIAVIVIAEQKVTDFQITKIRLQFKILSSATKHVLIYNYYLKQSDLIDITSCKVQRDHPISFLSARLSANSVSFVPSRRFSIFRVDKDEITKVSRTFCYREIGSTWFHFKIFNTNFICWYSEY